MPDFQSVVEPKGFKPHDGKHDYYASQPYTSNFGTDTGPGCGMKDHPSLCAKCRRCEPCCARFVKSLPPPEQAHPLLLAAEAGDPEAVERLLTADAWPRREDCEPPLGRFGEHPLCLAVRSAALLGGGQPRTAPLRCVRLLLDARAPPDMSFASEASIRGATALLAAVTLGEEECVAALLRGGAHPDDVSADGDAAVHAAAHAGAAGLVRQVIEAKCNVNAVSRKQHGPYRGWHCTGLAPLHLVAAGAQWEAWRPRAYPASMRGAQCDHAACVRLLLDARADPEQRSLPSASAGRTPEQCSEGSKAARTPLAFAR